MNWGLLFFRLWLLLSSGWMLLVTYGEKDRITRPEQWFSFAVVPPLAVGVAGWLIHVLLRWLRQYWAGR